VGKAPGLAPRLIAFAGSYLMLVLPFFPSSEMSLGASVASAALMFLGNGLSVYVLFWLGRSLSIMAEARRLVTTGPYAVVRHPLYVAEELAVLGLFIQFASAWAAVLLVIHIALQFRRMRYEENVLRDTFPEYGEYAQRTRRLIPGIY
jgi:protein-S-isoprenylcysteine O-methyltransferase Ste14